MPSSSSRPLSPHLQIYKPQISSVLSILHRLTGVALALGMVVFCGWILSVAHGWGSYDSFTDIAGSWYGRVFLFGWSWCFFYHFLTGLRHLVWDMGKGFSIKTLHWTGWLIVILSSVFTISAWICGYYAMGAL